MGVHPPILVAVVPVAWEDIDDLVLVGMCVVLVDAHVVSRIPEVAGRDQLVVGQGLRYVVQVPLEILAAQPLTEGRSLRHVAVVAKAILQGLAFRDQPRMSRRGKMMIDGMYNLQLRRQNCAMLCTYCRYT